MLRVAKIATSRKNLLHGSVWVVGRGGPEGEKAAEEKAAKKEAEDAKKAEQDAKKKENDAKKDAEKAKDECPAPGKK